MSLLFWLDSSFELTPSCSAADHGSSELPCVPDGPTLDKAARLLRAIADPERLRLLFRLSRAEACVTELAVAEGETLSTISQRLRVLRAEDLVIRQRHGKHISYALADHHVTDLILTVITHIREAKKED